MDIFFQNNYTTFLALQIRGWLKPNNIPKAAVSAEEIAPAVKNSWKKITGWWKSSVSFCFFLFFLPACFCFSSRRDCGAQRSSRSPRATRGTSKIRGFAHPGGFPACLKRRDPGQKPNFPFLTSTFLCSLLLLSHRRLVEANSLLTPTRSYEERSHSSQTSSSCCPLAVIAATLCWGSVFFSFPSPWSSANVLFLYIFIHILHLLLWRAAYELAPEQYLWCYFRLWWYYLLPVTGKKPVTLILKDSNFLILAVHEGPCSHLCLEHRMR